jgi:mortality factor 4-like protein 1
VDISRLSKLPREEGEEGRKGDENGEDAAKKRKRVLMREAAVPDNPPLIASEVTVELPKLLRSVLFEDWKRIVGLGCLVSLPRRPSVFDVVRDYIADVLAARKLQPQDEQILREVMNGFLKFFDRSLGLALL